MLAARCDSFGKEAGLCCRAQHIALQSRASCAAASACSDCQICVVCRQWDTAAAACAILLTAILMLKAPVACTARAALPCLLFVVLFWVHLAAMCAGDEW
jgi:hypothetical protein